MLNAWQSVVIVEHHQTLSRRARRVATEENQDGIACGAKRIKIRRDICDMGPYTQLHTHTKSRVSCTRHTSQSINLRERLLA